MTNNRDYRLRFGASHSEAYEVEMIQALITRGHVVEPMAMSAVTGLPTPGPVAPATVAPAARPAMPTPPALPFNATWRPSGNGNGFKAYDPDLDRVVWLFNDDARPMADGTSGAHRVKAKILGRWVGVESRDAILRQAASLAPAAPAAPATTRRGRFPRA